MKDPSRIKRELLEENTYLMQKIQKLEQSERKRVEEALQKSEDRYRQIAEGLSDYLLNGADQGWTGGGNKIQPCLRQTPPIVMAVNSSQGNPHFDSISKTEDIILET